MVSAVLASFIASNLGGFAWLVYTNSQRYLFSSHPEAVGLFAASLAPPIAGYALITTGMLVGGLLGSPRRELATPR